MKKLVLAPLLLSVACAAPTTPSATMTPYTPPAFEAAPPASTPAPTVLPLTVAFTYRPSTVEAGKPVTLRAAAENAQGAVRFAWHFSDDGGAPTTETGSITHAFSAAGQAVVTVTAIDDGGRTASAHLGVTVGSPSAATPASEEANPSQQPLRATLTCTAGLTTVCNISATAHGKTVTHNLGAVLWIWGDGAVENEVGTTPYRSHTYPQVGTYRIEVTVATANPAEHASASFTAEVK